MFESLICFNFGLGLSWQEVRCPDLVKPNQAKPSSDSIRRVYVLVPILRLILMFASILELRRGHSGYITCLPGDRARVTTK